MYLTAAFLCLAATCAFAQSAFGIKGGISFASEYSGIDGQYQNTGIAASFHIGGFYNERVSRGFSIQPGLLLQGKGGKYDYNNQTYTDRLLYAEVPVSFMGNIQAGRGEIFVGGGPYLAYMVSARLTVGGRSSRLNLGDQPDEIRPFDAGLHFLTGYRFAKGLILTLSSSAGFVNMSNQSQLSITNRVSSVSIGYEFVRR